MTNPYMRQFLSISTALSDENRVRALLALRCGELCLCQITELLQLAPSTVSRHLSLLKQAGLVESRKQGRWMYCRIGEPDETTPEARQALQWAASALSRDPRVIDDARRLKAILKENLEDLCKRQCQRRECCSSAPAAPAAARWPRGGRASSRAT
jgi:ArsR family transcriptional regulator, arsenate/arsenite/antimonite-responsive transcriptional repressor